MNTVTTMMTTIFSYESFGIISIAAFIIICFYTMYKIGMQQGVKLGMKVEKESGASVFDSTHEFLEPLHKFIDIEFNFEIHKRLISGSTTDKGSTLLFLRELGNNEDFSKIMVSISTIIISKISDDIRKAFFRLYKEEDNLYEYVSRAVFLKLRKFASVTIYTNIVSKDEKLSDVSDKILLNYENTLYNLIETNTLETASKRTATATNRG